VVAHRVIEVGVESIKELVNKLLCTTKTGSFADLVVIMCQRGISKSDILAYLCVLGTLLLGRARMKLTERGKCVKSWKRMDMAVRRSASLRDLMSRSLIRIMPSIGS
jgi:hypothetical protein